ncbi:hypothetical protein [Haloferula sp.]|uniref:hypothetical protein n=1 Tax=Haloferula sp. TaxID=2497595 RepID=UPI00329AFD87
MANLPPLPLASIEAMRPVFMIVMGLSILFVSWRLTRHTSGWSSRILMAGALLLTLGYSLILPLYQAKVIIPMSLLIFYPQVDAGTVMGWHLAKLFSMNGGWLLFGLGLALHARVFESVKATRPATVATSTPHSEPSLG